MSDDLTGEKGLVEQAKNGVVDNGDLELEPGETPTKVEAAVGLKIVGASYTTIAREVGFSSAYRARICVERALAGLAEDPDERQALKNLHTRRLERLLSAVMPRALDHRDPEQLAYHQAAFRVEDRLIKMHGVDEASKVEITSADGERLKDWVNSMLTLAGQAPPVEADIIDLEAIEEEIEDAEPEG